MSNPLKTHHNTLVSHAAPKLPSASNFFNVLRSMNLQILLILQFAIWCEVPHCVEDHNVTSRCIVLDRLIMEIGCCLLDIYLPRSVLFHFETPTLS